MSLLIIGVGTDGPNNTIYKPNNFSELRKYLGADYTQRIYSWPDVTQEVLEYEPWTLPANSVNGRTAYLFSPAMSGSILQFGSLGGTGFITLDVTYTPYLGKSDLLAAAINHEEVTNTIPFIARLGGTRAKLNIGDWEFTAKYAGAKYNKITLTWTGSSFLCEGLEPNFSRRSYTLTINDLKKIIDFEHDLGLLPIRVTKFGTSLISFASTNLTGGTDGTITDSELSNFLDYTTIPAEVTHILVLSPLTSGYVNTVNTFHNSYETQPRMFMFPSPTFYGPASSWLSAQATGIPIRSNYITSFIGDVTVTIDNKEKSRYAAELASIAYMRDGAFNLTNLPIKGKDFTPVLSQSDLISVKSLGFVPLMRYIRNDISVYEGVTIANNDSFLYVSKTTELHSIITSYVWKFVGKNMPVGPQPVIAEELMKRFARVKFLTVDSVLVDVYSDVHYFEGKVPMNLGQVMTVWVTGSLPGEILNVKFTINNK